MNKYTYIVQKKFSYLGWQSLLKSQRSSNKNPNIRNESPFELLVRGVQETPQIQATSIVLGYPKRWQISPPLLQMPCFLATGLRDPWTRVDLEASPLRTSFYSYRRHHAFSKGERWPKVLPGCGAYKPQPVTRAVSIPAPGGGESLGSHVDGPAL